MGCLCGEGELSGSFWAVLANSRRLVDVAGYGGVSRLDDGLVGCFAIGEGRGVGGAHIHELVELVLLGIS